MQTAEQILQAMHKLGEIGIPLTRVYRCLFSEDLFLAAYDKIARNHGALTAGTDKEDTVDGMNLSRIRRIIEQLRNEHFRFHPVRRIQIPKKKGGTRPLGMPNFTDKLVQEVIRMLLEAYYEPRFRNSSHGFRPGRGCHTALASLKKFKGATWFIEGDIRGCFDNIDHQVLMEILSRDIQDGRLLNLIRMLLKAGYMEDWHYNRTYSGTPQGGILSPLLANICLNELDAYIEDVLVPQNTRGKKRASNREYRRFTKPIKRARRAGDNKRVKELEQQRRQLPSQDVHDPNFRRLYYVRYADDFILGYLGTKSEAEGIKAVLGAFLRDKLHLEMSASKTLITHGRTQHAHFLGYDISIYQADHKLTLRTGTRSKIRDTNACVRLGIPYGKVDELARRYLRNGKPVHEAGLLAYSDAEIINVYQQRFRGIAEYYKYATDRSALGKLKFAMEVALTKTLANTFKMKVPQVYRKYGGKRSVDGRLYKVLVVEVPTQNGMHYIYWGGIPLKVVKPGSERIDDEIRRRNVPVSARTDLIQRLQANECEVCGTPDKCEVHHIRKLIDLKNRWRGRTEKPAWVVRMIALRRKTLVVCESCHDTIHAGKPLPNERM